MKNGTGSMSRRRHTVMVMGPMSSTVVTLSRKADSTAVSSTNSTMMVQGLPFATRAHLMARNSNTPDCFTTATNSIMPNSTPSVLKSMCPIAVSNGMMCRMSSSMAPVMATRARCTFSVMMAIMATTKMATDMIWLVSISHRLGFVVFHGSFFLQSARNPYAIAQKSTIAKPDFTMQNHGESFSCFNVERQQCAATARARDILGACSSEDKRGNHGFEIHRRPRRQRRLHLGLEKRVPPPRRELPGQNGPVR